MFAAAEADTPPTAGIRAAGRDAAGSDPVADDRKVRRSAVIDRHWARVIFENQPLVTSRMLPEEGSKGLQRYPVTRPDTSLTFFCGGLQHA
jgi:hypothetical protein